MVTSHTNDELNSELRSANKSDENRHQKFKFAPEETSTPTSNTKEHLSSELLEIIQTILFMII